MHFVFVLLSHFDSSNQANNSFFLNRMRSCATWQHCL